MPVVNARVYYRHTDTSSQVALLTKLVNSSHDVRVVIALVARSVTAANAVRVNTTAEARAMGDGGNLTPRLFQLPNGRDLLHYRPGRDLLNNGSLVLVVVQQSERTTVEKSEGQVVVETSRDAMVLQSREEAGRGLHRGHVSELVQATT
jgi:hypothetical protein